MNRPTPSERAESLSPSCSQKLVSKDVSVLIAPRLRMALINEGLPPRGIFRQVVSQRGRAAQGQSGPPPPPPSTGRAPAPFSPAAQTALYPEEARTGQMGSGRPLLAGTAARHRKGLTSPHYIEY